MPKYLVSVSYSAEGAKGVRQDGGTKRREVAGHAVESVGGKIEAFYFCFGDRTRSSSRTCPTPRPPPP
jgi:uncharacterized protein with GYD domain